LANQISSNRVQRIGAKVHKVKRLVGRPLLSGAVLIVAAATSFFSLGAVAYGQGITTGTITGTVVDPSGAAVPNSRIVATSNSQGTQRDATSFQNTPVRCRAT
jgi:hypothetical protein